jgi:hypothetical protein
MAKNDKKMAIIVKKQKKLVLIKLPPQQYYLLKLYLYNIIYLHASELCDISAPHLLFYMWLFESLKLCSEFFFYLS